MAFDYTAFNQGKRAAYGTYGAKAAQNAYAQFLSQQRGARKKFDLQQQQEKQTPQIIGSYTKRGLAGPGVKSGIFNKGMTDFAQQNLQAFNELQGTQNDEINQLKFEQAQNQAELDQQIAALEAQKQQNISKAAATLLAFKPFLK